MQIVYGWKPVSSIGRGKSADPKAIYINVTRHSTDGDRALSISIGALAAKKMGFIDRDKAIASIAEDNGNVYLALRRSIEQGCVVDGKRGKRVRIRFGEQRFAGIGFEVLASRVGNGIEATEFIEHDGWMMVCVGRK